MTENRAIEIMNWYSEEEYGKGSQVAMAHMMASKALEEIQQYRAIGTVEEFKALKEQEEALARNVNMVGNLQDIAMKQGYNKAIDDFAEALVKHTHKIPSRCLGGANVLEIAEQMKAGGMNG